jgi:hypothetical protein
MTSVPRPFSRLLCSLIYSFVSIVGLAAPASADTPGCVSRTEFSVVQNKVAGHARTERMVQGLFDARGGLEIRNPGRKLMFYRACWARNQSVWVGYKWEYGRLGPGSFGRGWFYEFKSTSL